MPRRRVKVGTGRALREVPTYNEGKTHHDIASNHDEQWTARSKATEELIARPRRASIQTRSSRPQRTIVPGVARDGHAPGRSRADPRTGSRRRTHAGRSRTRPVRDWLDDGGRASSFAGSAAILFDELAPLERAVLTRPSP